MIELSQRRAFFDEYPETYSGHFAALRSYKLRQTCPCCGYPTLNERRAYEVCFLCAWEDDILNDERTEEPSAANQEFTLRQARENFREYSVMYRPGNDPRVGHGDTPEERTAKNAVRSAFETMLTTPYEDHGSLWQAVLEGEGELYRLLEHVVQQHERPDQGL